MASSLELDVVGTDDIMPHMMWMASSLEVEEVGTDDIMPHMMWTRHFLLAQGVEGSITKHLISR